MNDLGMAPRWGGWLSRALARALLRLFGWRLELHFPDVPKLVLTGGPHTSNWDGIFGVSAILAAGVRINWFAKDSLFRWPFGSLLVWLGGVPIRRDKARGVVEQTADIFAEKERIYIVVAPEGTRSRAPDWKSGFYRIAVAAKVPIQIAYMDYRRKVVGTGPLIWPSGDYAADLETIQAFYRTVTPRHPERFAAES
jgi:1-acyl-sn-glycerol-3-phosphate acyltransferase